MEPKLLLNTANIRRCPNSATGVGSEVMLVEDQHVATLLEEMRDRFRVFEEMLRDVQKRLDRLEERTDRGFAEVNLEIRSLKVEIKDRIYIRIDDLDRRVFALEKRA